MKLQAAMFIAAVVASAALGQETAERKVLFLETYEPSTIGFTNDSDDERFLDVKLSVKYPLIPTVVHQYFANSQVYIAATVRFGQYLGKRESSPVVGKRFNPKLIWRQRGPSDLLEYVDVSYAHESNGQSINSHEEFIVEAGRQQAAGGRASFARDYISRGWDYLEIASKHTPKSSDNAAFRVYPSLRWFLPQGFFQGGAEEYNQWEEDPEGKPRRHVHGLALLLKQESWKKSHWVSGSKFVVGWETGYSRPFRHNTVRVEAGAKMWEVPLIVFYQQGYGSDLALYYKRVSSVGIALEIAGF